MTTKGGVKFKVRCADYDRSPRFPSREAAERWKAQVEEAGHCRLDHEVIETEGK